jgi:hypothetical protein
MSQPSPGRDRRAVRRRLPKRSTKIVCRCGSFGTGPDVAVAILDLSETGARLLVKAELAPRREVELTLESVTHRRPVKVVATVIWRQDTPDGNHIIGLRFQKHLNYGDLLGAASE